MARRRFCFPVSWQGLAAGLMLVILGQGDLRAVPGAVPPGQEGESRREISAELALSPGNGGELVLVVTNLSARLQSLTARIDLGTEAEMRPAGSIELRLPARETMTCGLRGAAHGGSHYILSIYRERRLILYTHAPLRNHTGPAPASFLTLQNPGGRTAENAGTTARKAVTPTAPPVPAAPAGPGSFVPPPDVELQARLLADDKGDPTTGYAFVVAFSLHAERTVPRATLSIRLGKFSESRVVSIDALTQVQFRLPEVIEEETIRYRLTSREGKLLLEGDLPLSQLMGEDGVLVNDIQLDRPEYAAGETVGLTLLLGGKTRSGYRIEISARDAQGTTFHRDQRLVVSDQQESFQSFSLPLPRPISGPVTLEYRLIDAANSNLCDSGEKQIPIRE